MDLIVEESDGVWTLSAPIGRWRCAIGRSGISDRKREGDGATPIGCWPLRQLFYRPDREEPPETALPHSPLRPDAGWCDDPEAAHYNELVSLPHPARHERLWREDELYDLLVVLGYNDSPPIPGAGSAIFLHVAREGYEPTEGCVALAKSDLRDLLAPLGPKDRLCVRDSNSKP